METIICGVGFCPDCAKIEIKTNTPFVVHGSRGWHVYLAEHTIYGGFVPHVYSVNKIIGENIIILKRCSFCAYECYFENGKAYFRSVKDWERTVMTLSDWNALVKIHHDHDKQWYV